MTTINLPKNAVTFNVSIIFLIIVCLFAATAGCSSSTDSDSDSDSGSGEVTYDLMRMDFGNITDTKFGSVKVEANNSESVYLTLNITHADFQHNSYDVQLSDADPNAGGTRVSSFANNERKIASIGSYSQVTASGRYIDVMRSGASPGSSGVARSKK
jgi:hypothetical protein